MNDETKQTAGSKFPLSALRILLSHCHRSQHQNRAWLTISALISLLFPSLSNANPTGGSVAQGTATINSSGSQLTINQSSANAFINWSSFNIGQGETTTFIQPSSSSVAWNQINDANPSQILGNLNANGFVVLQNQNGFYVGGYGTINTHGLVMTTARAFTPDLSSSGAWSFNTPPPMANIQTVARIKNDGQINVAGGNSAFLIASDIVNNGTISAPGGKIGLYAGQTVLVSASPDGRGLSAQVTLPQGSVDNEGKLIADAGSIIAQAKTVNQNGLLQANSVQNVNGVIELLAGDTLNLGGNSIISAKGDSPGVTTIDLNAGNTIEVGGLLALDDLTGQGFGNVNLTAGNNIILDDGSAMQMGIRWNLNLTAGLSLPNGAKPTPGIRNYGIYLDGDSSISTSDGNISLWSANDILVNGGSYGGITTYGGGNISATAINGDINTGKNVYGFSFGLTDAPYYSVNQEYPLGGISTAYGGNVSISAGGNVISYIPIQTGKPSDYINAQYDGGTGAFGALPGNVTISAGGNVYGHYVVVNGKGTINAGGDVGSPLSILGNDATKGFSLSLVKGSWNVNAPSGNIYIQEVRNPNGVFGEYQGSSPQNYAGYHMFDYDQSASVFLNAANTVEITGYDLPHSPPTTVGLSIPILLPPILNVIAGSGGFILDTTAILFPSPNQSLSIVTLYGGNFGIPSNADPYSEKTVNLIMSTSAVLNQNNELTPKTQFRNNGDFGLNDQPSSSLLLNNLNPVTISIDGNMNDINLYASKATRLFVNGDMVNSGVVGQNLHSEDNTSITVGGKIYNNPTYSFASLNSPITSANPFQPDSWESVFSLALNPSAISDLASINANSVPNGLNYYLKVNNILLFAGPGNTTDTSHYGVNPGFVYDADPTSLQLGFYGSMKDLVASKNMTMDQISALESGKLTVLQADAHGNPIIDANGHLQTYTYNFSAAPAIGVLYNESQHNSYSSGIGIQIGGPGHLTVRATSIDLGNSDGIGSDGFSGAGFGANGFSYASLKALLPVAAEGGATIDVKTDADLDMATSGIYSRDGGKITVNAGGAINLSKGTFIFKNDNCYGISSSGHSDVEVTANGNINIGSSRIATFNGGNVLVESDNGNVNAGTGANIALLVYGYVSTLAGVQLQQFGNLNDTKSLQEDPAPYGSGILAQYPTLAYQSPGGRGEPGNITVNTPHGNIVSTLGGIAQFALNQSISGNPTVSLTAGLAGVPASDSEGNIDLGLGGVVGGTVNINATGKVNGLVVSQHDVNISSHEGFNGTVLAVGSANFSGGGSVSGTVVGIGGINVSGGTAVAATLLSQNVNAGGNSESTLGTTASATTTGQSATGQANSDQKRQQLANNDTSSEDDDKKKKGKPVLQRIKRVTVLLPKAS